MNIVELSKQADLTLEEVAGICGVTRMSVYIWGKGGNIHPLRKGKVEKLTAAMESALLSRDFPVSVGKHQKDPVAIATRAEEIKSVIVKHLRKVTQPA